MAKKIARALFKTVQGRYEITVDWGLCSRDSAICVNASEWASHSTGGGRGSESAEENYFSSAIVYVTNVGGFGMGGRASGVMFFLHVDSEYPINVMVTLAYLGENNINEDPPVFKLGTPAIPVGDRDTSGNPVMKHPTP